MFLLFSVAPHPGLPHPHPHLLHPRLEEQEEQEGEEEAAKVVAEFCHLLEKSKQASAKRSLKGKKATQQRLPNQQRTLDKLPPEL